MSQLFNANNFKSLAAPDSRYAIQLRRLRKAGLEIACIEEAVRESTKNLKEVDSRRFVIYGEPQSGKTEMMICLTAKLLDEGFRFVVHLLNDSVDLLNQNLLRFKRSGLSPAARGFEEILDPAVDVNVGKYVVFSKKNARNLQKLIDKLDGLEGVVIIDDEADYASPNSKVNRHGERTAINRCIDTILGEQGVYIGVTATPARLDLNNTFDNETDLWVNFPAHGRYTGQDVFFPIEGTRGFRLTLLPNTGDEPRYARDALFSFLVNVAYLNLHSEGDENYSMLVHTSGKKADHVKDWRVITKTLEFLKKPDSKKFESYVEQIWTIALDRYPDADPDDLTKYIIENISRQSTIVLNSSSKNRPTPGEVTNPTSLFTVIIGGNIVSRGVTFNNLLSMFFTRDVKHKLQQDTYIQRARMFGSRGDYLKYFELTIPQNLYLDWHRCFVFHRLSLSSIQNQLGAPVWLGDGRVKPVASASIDKSTVDMNRGEMGFGLFEYEPKVDDIVSSKANSIQKIKQLSELLSEGAFPEFLQKFILATSATRPDEIAVHPTSFARGGDVDQDRIERRKGFMGRSQLEKNRFPLSVHHLKIFRNDAGSARLIYKFERSIQFIRNTVR